MVVTWLTCHPKRSLLKLVAAPNMVAIFVTLSTFHPERSLVKLVAASNMFSMMTMMTASLVGHESELAELAE